MIVMWYHVLTFVTWSLLTDHVNTLAHNACFLNNGQCRYQIQVRSECDRNHGDVLNNPRSYARDTLQDASEHAQKMLLQTSSEQTKRIRELENKIDKVLTNLEQKQNEATKVGKTKDKTKARHISAGYTNSTIGHNTKSTGNPRSNAGFKKDPSRKENQLLNKVHREFSKLRNELTKTRKQLKQSSDQLTETTAKLNQSEASLLVTSRRLSDTERKLEDEQQRATSLVQEVSELKAELNTTKAELTTARTDIKKLKLDNWRTRTELSDCEQQLEECLAEKEMLRRALEQALIKYHDLNLRHENVTMELNLTRSHLFKCYRGYYMFVEATNSTKGDVARLVSPVYMGQGEQCVEFYYHMNGDHVGILNVFTKVPYQDVVPMWRAFGNQGDVWSMARIPIGEKEARKGYQVVFEVSIGGGGAGDIAIDDVRVSDEPCYSTTTARPSLDTTTKPTPRRARSRSNTHHTRS